MSNLLVRADGVEYVTSYPTVDDGVRGVAFIENVVTHSSYRGKGYATEKAAQLLVSMNCSSYVLNIGGNIRIIGTKKDGSGWKTGIKDPSGDTLYALYLEISDTSCVTSGDYERYYTVEGTRYHHIIDKDTLMPATYFSSITILAKDSGLADALSTALFSMSYEDGRALVDSLEGVEAIWIYKDKTIVYTDGVNPINLES